MDQLTQILQAVQETNRRLDTIEAVVTSSNRRLEKLEGTVSDSNRRLEKLEGSVSAVMEEVAGLSEWRQETDLWKKETDGWKESTDKTQNKMLALLIDTRDRVERVETGFEDVQAWKKETIDKLDGFLVILDRHESEIAALGGLWQQQAQG